VTDTDNQDAPPPQPLMRITNAPPIMTAPNPTTKRTLRLTKGTHSWVIRNITPGSVPKITQHAPRWPLPIVPAVPTPTLQQSPRTLPTTSAPLTLHLPRVRFVPIDDSIQQSNMISQEAIDFLTECVRLNSPDILSPTKLCSKVKPSCLDLAQVASPMVHPTTGETISSYKKLMHDPATSRVWQAAFGKDFGGMAQGNEKTGQKGTNTIFSMTHNEIKRIPSDRTVTYARVVVDFFPQKADPHQIQITAGGNLINYPGKLQCKPPISPYQNLCGIAYKAQKAPSTCVWISKISTSQLPWICLSI
jgi:hypothetical protein